MKLSEMKQVLAERGIQLTKSLGQNFLHDGNQLRRITAAAELKKTDKVLEIGPGLGPLTASLVEWAGEVLAIEKDDRLVRVLEERFSLQRERRLPEERSNVEAPAGPRPFLRLVHGDALEFLRQKQQDWHEWKLVANLPYSVASPILVDLAQALQGPERMVGTLQLEVARRLVAKPAEKDYGLLTLLVQMNYEPLGWFKVPASCFFPKPEVDSACVILIRREPLLVAPKLRETFVKIVKRGFSQRRKMMLKLLREDWNGEDLDHAFESLGLGRAVRAESVGLEQFAELAKHLHEQHSK
jgi:16S rRNA (adenine1518-N6/adenine1519-N6)-dimethyltransferase